jgi:hypothetical protein
MCVLRRVLEAAFWLLLVLGQLPGALLLLPVGLVVGTHDALAPALRDLLRWPPAEPVGPLPPARSQRTQQPSAWGGPDIENASAGMHERRRRKFGHDR